MPSPNTENFSSNMEKKFMSTASGDFPKETISLQLSGGIKVKILKRGIQDLVLTNETVAMLKQRAT